MTRCCLCREPEGQPRTFWPKGLEPTGLPGGGYRCQDHEACAARVREIVEAHKGFDEFGNDEHAIRLVAIAAHARGDYEAERIALDRLAMMERATQVMVAPQQSHRNSAFCPLAGPWSDERVPGDHPCLNRGAGCRE